MKAIIENGKIVRIVEVHGEADQLLLTMATIESRCRLHENPKFNQDTYIAEMIS